MIHAGTGGWHWNCWPLWTGGESLAPTGFEPVSQAPKARMLGHYTTGLRRFRRREWSWTYRLLPPGRYPPLGSRWEELLLPSP